MISECIYIYIFLIHIYTYFFIDIHITSRWSKQDTSHHQSMAERPTANVRPKRTPRRCPTRETTMRQAWKRAKVCGKGAEVIVERTRCFTRSLGGGFKCLNLFHPEILGNDPIWRACIFFWWVGEKPPTTSWFFQELFQVMWGSD